MVILVKIAVGGVYEKRNIYNCKVTEMTFLILLSIALALTANSKQENTPKEDVPLLTTPLGDIEGSLMKTRLGKTIYAFRGIRYAKAPINELRFQPPVPSGKWTNLYNATKDAPSCPQPAFDPTSEDCLFLNVYTTQLPKPGTTSNRPVIVYFHAGGFYSTTSSSEWAGPDYWMDQDIVLVTSNYRLGSLGFLSTGDKEAPGNMGLKDQVLVLKWVKQNIEAFGGDSNSVTICGYSAGGFSVTLHMLSPMSQGLFHKAIAMSGSIYGQQAVPTNQLELARKQARLVGCKDVDTSINIVKCLKTKTADQIADSLFGFREFGEDPVLLWTPVIESDFRQERFLTDHPIRIVTSGQYAKVPVLTGVDTDEFANRAFTIINNATLLNMLDKDFEKYAPIAFLYERNTENSKKISKGLRSFYFGEKSIDSSSLTNLAQLYADALIGFGVNRGAKLLAANSNQKVYYYRFNYKGRYSHFYLPDSNGTVPYGVVHHDDLIYLFYISKLFPRFGPSDPESQTVEKLTKLWSDFARTGELIPEPSEFPDNVKAELFTTNNKKYLDIGNKLQILENLYEDRYEVWEKLFPLSDYVDKKAG